VVIKVLKPGIEDILVADLNFVYVVARILEFLSPEISRTSLVSNMGTFLPLYGYFCHNMKNNVFFFISASVPKTGIKFLTMLPIFYPPLFLSFVLKSFCFLVCYIEKKFGTFFTILVIFLIVNKW